MPEGIVAGDQQPEADGTQTPGTQGAPEAAPGPKPSGVEGTPQQQAQAEKFFSYKEDRSDWIPRSRLNEVSGKLTAAERRAVEVETALQMERERVARLAGVTPQDPQENEKQQIRELLFQLAPGLKHLADIDEQTIQDLLEGARSGKEAIQQRYADQSEAALGQVEAAVADKLGVESLSPGQVAQIRRAYAIAAEHAMEARGKDADGNYHPDPTGNDFMSRHMRKDPTLFKEFADAFLKDWFEPARRSVTQASQRFNRPVPRGGRGQPVVTKQPEFDANDDASFAKALMQARRDSGN